MPNKKDIVVLFEEVGFNDLLSNLQIMGNKVIIDMVSPSPALHDKKRLEKSVLTLLENKWGNQLEVVLNIKMPEANTSASALPQIRGKAIPGIQQIIAIASGKGGVGKSTLTANLAISLTQMGFKVGVLDADIYGPSIPTMFDVEHQQPKSIEVEGKSKMSPPESYGVKIQSIGFFAGANQAVVWRGPMASKALNQMIHDTHWGELDFLLVDLPPGTGDIHLSLVQQLPLTGAVIISTPQKVALTDAKKGIAMFQMDAIKVPVLGLVENMAYFTPAELPQHKYYIFGENGTHELAEQHHLPFLGEIPLIQSIREAGDVGRPAMLQENDLITEAYSEVTQNMITSLVERNETLPPTEIVRITTMAGCSPVKK